MPGKVLGILDYGLRAFHRNPGVKTDHRVLNCFLTIYVKMASYNNDKYFYKVGGEIV